MIQFSPHALVYQALDQVLSDGTIAPGTPGAVFAAIDQLQDSAAPRKHITCAENIAIEIYRLRCSLSDHHGSTAVVDRLNALAEEWMAVAID